MGEWVRERRQVGLLLVPTFPRFHSTAKTSLLTLNDTWVSCISVDAFVAVGFATGGASDEGRALLRGVQPVNGGRRKTARQYLQAAGRADYWSEFIFQNK